jgi:hypothetical protein
MACVWIEHVAFLGEPCVRQRGQSNSGKREPSAMRGGPQLGRITMRAMVEVAVRAVIAANRLP